jgi:hypothetical protein
MQIEVDLLGIVNANAQNDAPLRPKHVVRVTAEQLGQWLQYERRSGSKNSPFRILPHSLIKIDPDIQRGLDTQGFAMQQPGKVMEIAQ